MKAFNKLSFGIVTFSILSISVIGSYNSMRMNDDAFMSDSSGIRFTKRLDEINGKVIIGRMAASSKPWSSLKPRAQEKSIKKVVNIEKIEKKDNVVYVAKSTQPEPAIKGDLDLKVSNVFHKKALSVGTFSGSAKTVDGVIEEIYVSLPGGKKININTRERMSGNIFQYEDEETRETKSGMFYEVKKGTYMITLTNDSKFPGARIELKAGEADIAYNDDHYSAQESWELDRQNEDQQESRVNDKREEVALNNQEIEQDYNDEYEDRKEQFVDSNQGDLTSQDYSDSSDEREFI